MDIAELAAGLPKLATPKKLIDNDRGIKYIAEVSADYIAPTLSAEDEPINSAVQLITAPAAAGKSMSAKAVAAISGALYADLGGRRVADGSFNGLLDEALGEHAALDFRDQLRQNAAVYVLDSLDETQLKSGELNFVAFIQGICRFSRGSSGSHNIILFARIDTAKWVIDTFEEEGVPLSVRQIEYFNKDQSDRYLDVKLRNLYQKLNKSQYPHRVHQALYSAARDGVYDRVAATFSATTAQNYWNNPEVARFLGYSPVLESIAGYLRVDDFRTLKLDALTSSEGDQSGPEWRILTTLINSLLQREHMRFSEGFADLIPSNSKFSIESAYTPVEQCLRLVGHVGDNTGVPIDIPATLPSELKAQYADMVGTQLLNHPFLSSTGEFVHSVFRDYSFATVLASAVSDRRLTQSVLSSLRANDLLASPALAPFAVDLVKAENLGWSSNRCDILLSSLKSQEDGDFRYSFMIYSHGGDAFFEATRVTELGAQQEATIRVPLVSENNTYQLPSFCEALKVDVEGDVEVAAPGRMVRVGPDVEIYANALMVHSADSIVIDSANGKVTIDCEVVLTPYVDLKFYGSEFSLFCESIDGSLAPYVSEKVPSSEISVLPVFYAVRRFFSFFRKTIHAPSGHLAADRHKVDTYILRNNQVAVNAVARLQKLQLVSLGQREYHLNLEDLSARGVRLEDFQSQPIPDALRELLEELVVEVD